MNSLDATCNGCLVLLSTKLAVESLHLDLIETLPCVFVWVGVFVCVCVLNCCFNPCLYWSVFLRNAYDWSLDSVPKDEARLIYVVCVWLYVFMCMCLYVKQEKQTLRFNVLLSSCCVQYLLQVFTSPVCLVLVSSFRVANWKLKKFAIMLHDILGFKKKYRCTYPWSIHNSSILWENLPSFSAQIGFG